MNPGDSSDVPERTSEEPEELFYYEGAWHLYRPVPLPPLRDYPEYEPSLNYQMWRDMQWSLRLAPVPQSPYVITGVLS